MTFNNLLVLGDSISYGCYASLFSKSFRELLAAHYDAEMLDGPHYWTKYNLPNLIDVWPNYRDQGADLIVAAVGVNDVIGFGTLVNSINEDEWQAAYEGLLTEMKCTGATVVVITPFAAVGSGHTSHAKMVRYNDYIRSAAQNTGVILADVYAATEDHPEYISRPTDTSEVAPGYAGDNFHPGDLGHARMAEVIISSLSGETPMPVNSIRANSGLVTFALDTLTGPTAVSFQEFGERAKITLVNPSPDRAMNVLASGAVTIALSNTGADLPPVTFAFDSRIYVNGTPQGSRNAGIIRHAIAHNDYFEFTSPNSVSLTLPAGATMILELAALYSAGAGFTSVGVSGTGHLAAIAVLI